MRIAFSILFFNLVLLNVVGQPSQTILPMNETAYALFEIEHKDFIYNDISYRIFIANPKSEEEIKRSVLYILDGSAMFPMMINEIETVDAHTPIIIGLGYPSDVAYPKERIRDYTIPIEGSDEGGGAAEFYCFINEIVKPFVGSSYAVDIDKQTLSGHSFGGLFVLYTLFNHTNAFQQYVAGSPSIWWGNGSIIPTKEKFFVDRPTSVVITWGEYEEYPEKDPVRKELTPEIRALKDSRRGGATPRELSEMLDREVANNSFVLFEGKNHGSSIPDYLTEAYKQACELGIVE